MQISRTVLHYNKGNSDKIYIVDIELQNKGYQVYVRWGKRTEEPVSKLFAVSNSIGSVQHHADKKIREKINKGYQIVTEASIGLRLASTSAPITNSISAPKPVVENYDNSLRKLKL